MSCYISDMCTDVQCCVDVSLIKRSFEITLKLDTCRYQLEVEIDRLKINVALVDYKFGKSCPVISICFNFKCNGCWLMLSLFSRNLRKFRLICINQ
jgi:hypothetical protein